MLNLPQQTINKVKRLLLRQQQQVTKQIKHLEDSDPVMIQVVAEPSEPGTESWKADVHARAVAVKNDLVSLSKKITTSLMSLRNGTYGKCEKCGAQIEVERLKAMPSAGLCVTCSKSSSKKR
ncbi:MAG: TraR/DksA C4-type zinc finger protein [bacterium]|nr:TraR/DksA C4-type zinc finger protein [bacterium]